MRLELPLPEACRRHSRELRWFTKDECGDSEHFDRGVSLSETPSDTSPPRCSQTRSERDIRSIGLRDGTHLCCRNHSLTDGVGPIGNSSRAYWGAHSGCDRVCGRRDTLTNTWVIYVELLVKSSSGNKHTVFPLKVSTSPVENRGADLENERRRGFAGHTTFPVKQLLFHVAR